MCDYINLLIIIIFQTQPNLGIDLSTNIMQWLKYLLETFIKKVALSVSSTIMRYPWCMHSRIIIFSDSKARNKKSSWHQSLTVRFCKYTFSKRLHVSTFFRKAHDDRIVLHIDVAINVSHYCRGTVKLYTSLKTCIRT